MPAPSLLLQHPEYRPAVTMAHYSTVTDSCLSIDPLQVHPRTFLVLTGQHFGHCQLSCCIIYLQSSEAGDQFQQHKRPYRRIVIHQVSPVSWTYFVSSGVLGIPLRSLPSATLSHVQECPNLQYSMSYRHLTSPRNHVRMPRLNSFVESSDFARMAGRALNHVGGRQGQDL